jgi:hypothetical protein
LLERAGDAGRPAGHFDTDAGAMANRAGDAFLELPGPRIICEAHTPHSSIQGQLDAWWRSA